MKGIFYSLKGMRKFTMLLFLLPSTMLFTLAGVSSALAEDQIVSLTPAISTQNTGSSFILTANYDVSDNDNTLSTLGVQFHYDSSKLQFDGFSNVFAPGFIAQQGPFDDTGDSDFDADTDKFVVISWFDFSGNWPNQALPITLTDLNFTLSAGASDGDSTPVNVNITQTAASHTALGNNATINILKVPVCGDSVVDDGEDCDDGNADNTDACLDTCVDASCGDGFVQSSVDQCDDGNEVNDDNCSNACTLPVCGDSIVNGNDQCDDGNEVNDDACTDACTLPVCGDSIVNGNDQCDDGNQINDDACTNACALPGCGDGIVNGDEACDDGNQVNNDNCSNACTLPVCGDSIVNGSETCDDGNQVNDDNCTNACTLPVCGDSIVNGNEACDDGNQVNDDACTNACALPGCGDGIVNGNEACDDGNQVNDDNCSNACTLPVCGDSIVNGNEECDDGNNIDNDGCQANCALPICSGGDDTDTDSDTIPDCNDNCLNTENPGQDDADEDGAGDACDVCPNDPDDDADQDNVCGDVDNCPTDANENQADDDNDGVGDVCDACEGFDDAIDYDDDGVADSCDSCTGEGSIPIDDSDGDGVCDSNEMGPNGNDDQFDGNNDGTPDIDQKYVSSLFVNGGQDYVTLAANAECFFESMINVPNENLDSSPPGAFFAFGVFDFTLDCSGLDPANQIMVTLYMPDGTNQPGNITVNTFYKFGPEPGNLIPHWYEFLYDPVNGQETGAEYQDDDVFIYFIDGERGDDDLALNDIIIEPGGPAFVAGLPDPPTTSPASDGGSGGCFIDTVFSGLRKNR